MRTKTCLLDLKNNMEKKPKQKIKYPIFHYGIEQRSDEWFKLRELHMTASHASVIITGGKGLETYIYQLVADYIAPEETEDYKTFFMQNGIEREPKAIKLFEKKAKVKVELVSFVEKNKYAGCSPDGIIGKNEGIEVKSPALRTILRYKRENEIPKDYYNQCQMNMFITGRKKWYLVFYHPKLKNKIIIHEILPDTEVFEKLKDGLKKGENLIKENLKNVK